jgi:hypothetical protein
MRRFTLRFSIALLTFVIGVAIATFWYSRPTYRRAPDKKPVISLTAEADNIAEAVFRNQVSEEGKSEPDAVFFLSRGENADPNDEFMRRFEGMPRVRRFSQCNKRGDGVTDKKTGARGMILKIYWIEWINDAEVKVGVGTYAWGWGQSGSVCRVVRGNTGWVVKGCELKDIT